ncbi:phosphatase phospho-type [Glomus cerebriforme]|uniref:Phosphatase phospho-type n=1 Tax=Glomus cerebriforme TaxID=658196 RepID=A0A397TCK5_9GLOM|nr:phosphatase phospho-type [Glomus cerebriforme]
MKRLVVFDFDWSLIDNNSDPWVFEQLSKDLAEKIEELYKKIQWTDLMHMLLGELHQQGVTKLQIEDALAKIPFNPAMIEALKTIKRGRGENIILSDANTEFIDIILKAYGVRDLISLVISNPASWDENGRLHVKRLVSPEDPPHECENKCAINICKGRELINYLSLHPNEFNQIFYVGDSLNDFCPATKMSRNDVLMVRKGFTLEKFLASYTSKDELNPRIVYWQDAEDFLKAIQLEFK